MNHRNPQIRSALAGEYVLGTLHSNARHRFERLLETDDALRREVEHWQDALYPLVDTLPDREPPPRVWQAIIRQIAPPAVRRQVSLWNSLTFWRSWGLIASTIVLIVAIYLAMDLTRPVPPQYVAVISNVEQQAAWLAQADLAEHRLSVQALHPQEVAPDRSFELWLLPGEGKPPRSLGLIPAQGSTSLTLPPDVAQALPQAAGLAVSLEPVGGSPTGQPTGPVLYQGQIVPPA